MRIILIGLGTIFTGLGIVGIILPLLPTTPFLLLAAACYFRSSKKFYDWLLSNKWLGHYIKDYREKRGISLKVKIISITLLWVTISLSGLFATSLLWVRLLLLAVATGVTIHLTRLKTLKKVPKV